MDRATVWAGATRPAFPARGDTTPAAPASALVSGVVPRNDRTSNPAGPKRTAQSLRASWRTYLIWA